MSSASSSVCSPLSTPPDSPLSTPPDSPMSSPQEIPSGVSHPFRRQVLDCVLIQNKPCLPCTQTTATVCSEDSECGVEKISKVLPGPVKANISVKSTKELKLGISKRVRHLLTTKAFTSSTLPDWAPDPSKSMEERLTATLDEWIDFQGPVTTIRSNFTSEVLKTRNSWRGTVPMICEKPETIESFRKMSVEEFGSLRVVDGRGVLQALRFKVPPETPFILSEASASLPDRDRRKATSGSSDPLARGTHDQRHYATWCEFGNTLAYSKELKDDKEDGENWLKNTVRATSFVNFVLQTELPEQYRKATNPDLVRELEKRGLKNLFGGFHGVNINRGMTGDESITHLDWLDDLNSMNLVIPFSERGKRKPNTKIFEDDDAFLKHLKEFEEQFESGNEIASWTGAWFILWPLKLVIEVPEGYGILFSGRTIAHSLTKIMGVRASVDYFVHKALYDWLSNIKANDDTYKHHGKKKKKALAKGTKKAHRKEKTAGRVQKKRKSKAGGCTEQRARQNRHANVPPGGGDGCHN
ncbi:hypothetical protein BJ508DRAFT_327913 [Ascobolus immersus RN42]|uniref:Uncharacterized protein n=1 Tax=Ascobolus immersus RN42 TaxID=1160509 RepID=A0A3N4I1A5_ASCIM|nr:hypothetical protein BJ508DRAFT_327913 [Ascobolus immersus RN42]